MGIAEQLSAIGVYGDLVGWSRGFGDDLDRAIRECPRGDWVLALAIAAGAPRERIVRGACDCAGLVFELVEDSAIGPALAAVEAARAFCDRGAAVDPAIAARCEELAGHPDPLIQTAAIAAIACVLAIDDPREAPAAASSAVSASALHAADCGAQAAMSYAARRSAELARAAITA